MLNLVPHLLFFYFSFLVFTESEATKVTNPPNVLVVMVGDMGFSDLVSYGREIETPVMGSLATNGLRFTQFSKGGDLKVQNVSAWQMNSIYFKVKAGTGQK